MYISKKIRSLKIIILYIFKIIALMSFVNESFANAVIPKSSGIIKQEAYIIYINPAGGSTPMTYKADGNLVNNEMTPENYNLSFTVNDRPAFSSTSTSYYDSDKSISLFGSGAKTYGVEGVIHILFLLQDQADNISYNEVIYQTDFTAPDFKITGFIEKLKTTYFNPEIPSNIYFKNNNDRFKIKLNYDDPNLLDSGVDKSYLFLSGSYDVSTDFSSLLAEKEFNPASILKIPENSKGDYTLTICDNSVPNKQCTSTDFLGIRDNSTPSFGFYTDDVDLYDSTTTGTGFSKFIKANSAFELGYRIQDLSLGYNSGIKYEFKIEEANDPNSFTGFLIFEGNSDTQTGTLNLNLSKVDNDLNSNETYRLYSTKLISNGEEKDELCDNVENCIPYELTFRVISSDLNNDKSTLKYDFSTETEGKIFSNGSDKYNIEYSLKDEYNNKIVPVNSFENGGLDIKETTSTINFTNKLYKNLSGISNKGTKQVLIESKENDEEFDDNINNIVSGIIIKENSTTQPNGKYSFGISSRVPTYDFYPYINNDTKLTLNKITNLIEYNDSGIIIGNPEGEEKTIDIQITNGPYVITNTGSIKEDKDNKYSLNFFDNAEDLDEYGKYTFSGSVNTGSGFSFTELLDNKQEINFSFASPIIYGLKNFNILIDGQWIEHTKKIFKLSNVDIVSITEKLLVSYDTNKNEQIYGTSQILDYKIRTPNKDISFGNSMDKNYFGYYSKKDVEVRQSTLAGKTYDISKLKTGFASQFTYKINGIDITLPSIGRNIKDSDGDSLDEYNMSRNYYSDTYTIGNNTLSLGNNISEIGISGLVNSDKTNLTTDNSSDKGSVNISEVIGGKLTRYSLLTTFKKNISKYSRGINWCSSMTISDLNNDIDDCTIDISGEKVTFIKGDVTIDCGDTCEVEKKRSIIIKDGKVKINSNITTVGNTKGQLLIGNITNQGLKNIDDDIDDDTEHSSGDFHGWTFIEEDVTNIDSFLVSQGPVVSYTDFGDNNTFFTKNNLSETYLRNQLYIYGSIISLNNIGGSRKEEVICPYIIQNCNENIAQIFDFIYLRRYTEVPKSFYGSQYGNGKVPYHPNGIDISKKSGYNDNLRKVTDNDKKGLPLIIDRDKKWDYSPSLFTQFN
ncbi:MAG: hypothetical protein Q9M94_03785 [Candidatus Gracilibacteria bacterium]|nr:hypothetical protein [Candidatus Gracilibacteria bacterium]